MMWDDGGLSERPRVAAQRSTFPMSAIVGQEPLKLALLLCAVDPRIGGVLIRGSKGTAKSTAVRALASLLPEIDTVEGCPYGCHPDHRAHLCVSCSDLASPARSVARRPALVELPVSATEDRVVGTLDLEHALRHGERRFEPGLMAAANRGVLYIDEVNLLDDHLVDVLLDVAASGVNIVEREGLTVTHPARFVLVGTMNPEEGELRPQLLDRFGLCVDVAGIADPEMRAEILRRRQRFEDTPEAFEAEWASEESRLAASMVRAQAALRATALSDELLHTIASVCGALEVDGHRADLVIARAAVALAALRGAPVATLEHVSDVAPLALAHRVRSRPFEEERFDAAHVRTLFAQPSVPERADTLGDSHPGQLHEELSVPTVQVGFDSTTPAHVEQHDRSSVLSFRGEESSGRLSGRTHNAESQNRSGKYVTAVPLRPGDGADIAIDATIRAAAPFQRERTSDGALVIEPRDLQRKVRTRRVGSSIVFCVDASGSMGAARRMETAKAAILELLVDAYQRRDRVALVAFRGRDAEVVLSPTASVELAQLRLRSLPTGGATPLAHGLVRSLELLEAERRREADVRPWLVLITDGRANVGLGTGLGVDDATSVARRIAEANIKTLVIDTAGPGGGAPARDIARAAGAEYLRLGEIDSMALTSAVRKRVSS